MIFRDGCPELPAADGSRFLLDTATLCVLSAYHGIPAIGRWNAPLVPNPGNNLRS